MSNKIVNAIDFANEKHKNQTRKDGSPYIWHPIGVANMLREQGYGEDYQLAGLFHDLLEDTDATEDEILALSNEKVLTAVKLVTKTDDNKKSYYADILNNDIAKAVKNADRIYNLTDARNASMEFIERYLRDTKDHYLGKFSSDLDNAYNDLKFYFENCNK